MIDSVVKVIRGAVKIFGNTDNTLIGNVGDALKVTSKSDILSSKTFSALVVGSVIGNNKSMFSIVNASGSGVVIRIIDIRLINNQTTAITGVIGEFQINRITGHSVGTSVTPSAHDTVDTLSGLVTCRTGATVAGETVTLFQNKYSTDEWGVGAHDVESNDHILQSTKSFFDLRSYTKPVTLREGQGISLKHIVNSTAGSFSVFCLFTEEAQ